MKGLALSTYASWTQQMLPALPAGCTLWSFLLAYALVSSPLETPSMESGEGQCLCSGDLLSGLKEFSFPPEGTSPG